MGAVLPRFRACGLRNLEYWAVIAVALFVLTYTDDLIHEYDVRRSAWWFEDALLRGHVFALATGALSLAFAKPPRRVWVVGALHQLAAGGGGRREGPLQGLFGDEPPERQALEGRLDDLHDWPAAGPLPFPDRLPAQVSVVDVALALGPRNTWWANGIRGVRCALVPGLLAAVLSTWAGFVRGEAWRDTLLDLFGLPGMALGIVYWLSTWVGGGFFLGALWRVLPGRRGAVKEIPVVLAFSVPLALDALFGWFTQEGAANLALYAATMLLVLTVTGIALDLDTFRGERRYWQSRLGLLK
ncbi:MULTISPECIES: DUF6185 family protein [unclassified Streptomyces]|uniref:DUF6185 family protein n=1 Tax=unclassified Streptomyces TaxID=2593676 RepID=UPI0036EEF73B